MSKALQQVAERLAIDPDELKSIVLKTVMPSNKQPTNEQFLSFIAVANEYGLNPLTKEIYAFPSQGGGIQPIVSIDGWLKIINTHPEFNGMTFTDERDSEDKLIAITCNIFRKDTQHPTQVTEYMAECRRDRSEPWAKWPNRMLRHKAAIQAGRYAFGLSGIIDPDEAERFEEVGVIAKKDSDIPGVVIMNKDRWETNFPKYKEIILSGKHDAESLINAIAGKGAAVSEEQKNQLRAITISDSSSTGEEI